MPPSQAILSLHSYFLVLLFHLVFFPPLLMVLLIKAEKSRCLLVIGEFAVSFLERDVLMHLKM
jgi:hypothetical protein